MTRSASTTPTASTPTSKESCQRASACASPRSYRYAKLARTNSRPRSQRQSTTLVQNTTAADSSKAEAVVGAASAPPPNAAPERVAQRGGAGATPRRGGGGRRLPALPPNHLGESHERSMGSNVPEGKKSRGSVRTATALPPRHTLLWGAPASARARALRGFLRSRPRGRRCIEAQRCVRGQLTSC